MKKILVIGDSCLDMFQYGICERISPEAPVPVFKPTKLEGNDGMAKNVLNNLEALDIKCDIITNHANDTPTKTRFIDEVSNQMLLRIDEDDVIERIKMYNFDSLDIHEYDGVVISDYDKGFLPKNDISYISRVCESAGIPIFLDTKKNLAGWNIDHLNNITFIKINEREYRENEDNFDEYKNHLITTLGNGGAKHYDKTLGTITKYEIENKAEVRDLSGAGDTFLAGFVADYLENCDIASAIKFANKCASYVVTQKGVVVVDKEKI